ncbi:MAG: APC family permease [Nitrososphaeria archaeon]|nr:APC family permease [Nitrososphaeria archaeon]
MENQELFVRKASGLVRNISAWDALIFNVIVMGPGAVYLYGMWAAGLFPGVDLTLTAWVAAPVCLVIGLFYALFSVIMPRSGGDYVWATRILHPAIGFSMVFFIFIVLMAFVGMEIPWAIQWGLAPFLSYLGYGDIANLLSDSNVMMLLGVVYYAVCAVITIRGARAFVKAVWASFILIIVGIVAYVISLLSMRPETFATVFSQSTGMNYQDIISKAIANGHPSGFVFGATMLGIIYTILNFTGFNLSVYIAGEVKEVRKAQFIAIAGGILVFTLITWLIYAATYNAMGPQFVGAISYLAVMGSPDYTLPFAPAFHLLTMTVLENNLVSAIIVLTWAIVPLACGLTYMFTAVRLIFSWSFDRVLPQIFSKVDERYNSPYVALIFITVLSIIFEALWLFTPILSYVAYVVTGWSLEIAMVSIAGIVLPYVRKDIFETAPAMVKRKVLGLPLITLLGILSLIASIYIAYASLTPAIAGTLNETYIIFTFGIFVIGFIVYLISSVYHRVKGIPLELTFKEIPPE